MGGAGWVRFGAPQSPNRKEGEGAWVTQGGVRCRGLALGYIDVAPDGAFEFARCARTLEVAEFDSSFSAVPSGT